jgi:hypothetical protein
MKQKKEEIKDFIGVYDNYVPDMMIDQLIELFNKHQLEKRTYTRLSENSLDFFKADEATSLNFNQEYEGWIQHVLALPENIMMAINHYLRHVPIDKYVSSKELHFNTIKIQKTLPKQGYHVWHVEAGSTYEQLKRVLVYSMYLNDVEEGGETEFLYQSVRVKPVKGRIVIWPAYFPFVHRGNPPLKGEKYLLTSWLSGIFNI